MPNTQTLTRKLISLSRKPLPDQINSLNGLRCRLKADLYYRKVFGTFGSGSMLFKPTMLSNPQFMHVGKNVVIRPGVRLQAIMLDPNKPPELHIGDNVNIEQDVHIVCVGKVWIGDNVSIAARSSLLCGTHPFFDVDSPVKLGDRLSGENAVIEIGDGSLLGIGSVVSMNVRIGKRVVVGSSSVVKKDLPDYSVADGNPAVVVMQYDFDKQSWINLKQK